MNHDLLSRTLYIILQDTYLHEHFWLENIILQNSTQYMKMKIKHVKTKYI